MPDLVDVDTPQSARTRIGTDGQQYDLVFSDEFNTDGRTFYPGSLIPFLKLHYGDINDSTGDDPYWEAVDLWYGATMDLVSQINYLFSSTNISPM